MLVIRSQALRYGARPAEPLKPRCHFEIIHVGIIAAVGTDEFIYAVVAAVDAAIHDAGRLVPQERRAAVAGLTGERDRAGNVGPGTQPRVTAVMRGAVRRRRPDRPAATDLPRRLLRRFPVFLV